MIWQDQEIKKELARISHAIESQANFIRTMQEVQDKHTSLITDLQKSAPILQSSEITAIKADLDELKKRLFVTSPYTGKTNLSPYAKLIKRAQKV